MPVEDVIAESQRAGVVPDERLADEEGLCQPVGVRLHGMAQREAPLICRRPTDAGSSLRVLEVR